MMEFLEFAFRSVWHFVGVWILAAVVLSGVAAIVSAFRGGC